MKLVEIIVGMETAPEVVDRVVDFVRRLGKEEVVVNDFPGFATTRVGIMLISEAIFALQEGVAEKEALDKAIKLGYNHPMGPLALADLVGLDIVYHVLEALHENYKDPRYRPPILLKEMGDLTTASVISSTVWVRKAFKTLGRWMVIVATPSRFS